MDFEQFWNLMKPDAMFANRYTAAERAWNSLTADKQQAILDWLRKHGTYANRNPYFFIVDFQMPAQEPMNWNGRALDPRRQYMTAKWNGRWGTYAVEDVQQFNMEVKQ